jgi:hypothetical protein
MTVIGLTLSLQVRDHDEVMEPHRVPVVLWYRRVGGFRREAGADQAEVSRGRSTGRDQVVAGKGRTSGETEDSMLLSSRPSTGLKHRSPEEDRPRKAIDACWHGPAVNLQRGADF